MSADVGYMVCALNKSEGDRTIVTRDLLGESFSSSSSDIDHSQELDLDLQVPVGWEKHLDLKSGKVYLQKCSSATKLSSIQHPLKLTEDTNLDLKLDSTNNSWNHESVCTLDKVKFALEISKDNAQMFLSRPLYSNSPSTSSASKVTLEFDDHDDVEEVGRTINSKSRRQDGLLTAAGCPNCLMYVMISNEDLKCPKCQLKVCLPVMKKPRIDLDLNVSI